MALADAIDFYDTIEPFDETGFSVTVNVAPGFPVSVEVHRPAAESWRFWRLDDYFPDWHISAVGPVVPEAFVTARDSER